MTVGHEHDQPAVPEEAIAVRAYELYCARGCEGGHDVDDWLLAEAALREQARPALEQLATPAASATP